MSNMLHTQRIVLLLLAGTCSAYEMLTRDDLPNESLYLSLYMQITSLSLDAPRLAGCDR